MAEPLKKNIGVVFDGFLTFSNERILVHGFLIMILELGFLRLVNTLYFIVNIPYNAMKETKRVVNL